MEYGAPAFFPCTRREVQNLEYVQRLGSRWVPQVRALDYQQRCDLLGLFSMEYRRHRMDLITVFRVVVLGELTSLRPLFSLVTGRSSRGHPYRLVVKRSDRLQHIFRLSRRVVNAWNRLPAATVASTTVEMFKRCLDEFYAAHDYPQYRSGEILRLA